MVMRVDGDEWDMVTEMSGQDGGRQSDPINSFERSRTKDNVHQCKGLTSGLEQTKGWCARGSDYNGQASTQSCALKHRCEGGAHILQVSDKAGAAK